MITIRPARMEDASGMARVHVDVWRTTYKGIVPETYLANLSYQRREEMWERVLARNERTDFAAVALDDQNEVIGFINGGVQRDTYDSAFTAELYAIYILDRYHGQGVGRRLTRELVTYLVERNLFSMTVAVLAENPARHFYQALGAQFIREQEITIGDVPLLEQIYGWSDIRSLLV